MIAKSKINDLDYCYAVWQILMNLEKNMFTRNERIRAYQKQIHSREALGLSILSLVPIIFLWLRLSYLQLIFLTDNLSIIILGTRVLGLLMLSVFLYLIFYLLLKFLLQFYPLTLLRRKLEKKLRKQFIFAIGQIDIHSIALINELNAEKLRLPENLMSAELIEMLIRYFETGQVITINEAVYALRLELENTGYYSRLLSPETILSKVNSYLAQQKKFFERVEKGEI
ncbi:MAG: hypothetical protein LKF42_09675 [Streptococcaceae bacterium]|nr:hypothetical protein [Streptococcaceae bacterium]